MDRRKKYLRFLAFVPAIVLVGGFIGYRAGAFHRPAEPAPHSEQQSEGATQPAPNAAPPSRAIMYSSKSAEVFIPGSEVAPESTPAVPPAPPTPAPAKPPVFLLGSKSAPISGVVEGLTPPADPPKPNPNALPGGPPKP